MIAKRIFDFVTALFGVILLAPVFLVIAVLIKLDSKGPVFFRQNRVGQHGRTFRIFKFRTMVADLGEGGLLLTVARDARVTSCGRFLRRYKLDELPQLFDVLRGTMSLVGARPEVPRYIALYPEEARNRILSLKPGITDMAAIQFRAESEAFSDAADPEAEYVSRILPLKIRCYEEYVQKRSFWLDLRLIFRTLGALAGSSRPASGQDAQCAGTDDVCKDRRA